MRTLVFASLVALIATTGCASGSGGSGSSSSGSRNHITREELNDPVVSTMSAFDAIRRLRPRWLRSRASGSTGTQTLPIVVLDGSRYGDTSALASIRVSDVEEMRFLSARDATTRYGTGATGGAIVIESRR